MELPADTNVLYQPPWALVGTEPVEEDPTLEVLDGSRAIEVTVLLDDRVVDLRQLHSRDAGAVRTTTRAMLLVGGAAVGAGIVAIFASQPGLMALLLLLGTTSLVSARMRMQRERRSPHYRVGPAPGADLALDEPALPPPSFPLVRRRPWGHELLFTTRTRGEVLSGARAGSLVELRRRGQAWPLPGQPDVWCWPIPSGGRASLRLGPVTVLVRSLAPSRTIRSALMGSGGRKVTPFLVGALLLHALPLAAAVAWPLEPEYGDNGIGAGQLEVIRARIQLGGPPASPSPPAPPGAPSSLLPAEQLPESERGQVHAPAPSQPSFVRSSVPPPPSPTPPYRTGLYGLRGPRNNPDPHLAKRLAEASARNRGVLGLLSQQESPMIANQIGEAHGVGGLGLGLGGLRPRRARRPRVIAGRPQIRGSLDRESIRRVIRRHINEVKYCYQKELKANPNLYGGLTVRFTISSQGTVVASTVQRSSLGNQKVEQCIVHAVRRWLFPRPRHGGIVIVTYPFGIRSTGGG
jgi:TonB family protein